MRRCLSRPSEGGVFLSVRHGWNTDGVFWWKRIWFIHYFGCRSLDRLAFSRHMFWESKKYPVYWPPCQQSRLCENNHIEGDVGSACEVLYTLLEPEKVTRSNAEALYTGMIHDTGVFQYSSTTPRTMRIAACLMETGLDFKRIIESSFYEKTYVQNQVMGRVLAESILIMDGAFTLDI